jgi:serine/threonine-protein kinase
VEEPGAYYTPSFSPDGNRLALAVDHGNKGREIEVYDRGRATISRLTFSGEVNWFPLWSPDGRYIVFESASSNGYGIALVRSDGSGTLQRLAEHNGLMIPRSFSPDGRQLAYYEANPATGFDILIAPFDASDPNHPKLGKPEAFLNTPFGESQPAFSPDGRWIAYSSTESGRQEVYVQPFPGPGGKWKISTGGGNIAMWASHGRELFFRSPDGHIMVTDYVSTAGSFLASPPRRWSDFQIGITPFGSDASLAPDGKHFAVFPRRDVPPPAGSVHVTFLLNFFDELQRKLPGNN